MFKNKKKLYYRQFYLFECDCEKCLQQSCEPDVSSEEENSDSDDMEE